ncbi:MAG: alpha-N-arabinofuranosidase, partial [Planctomycetota bacterium]
MRGIRTDVVEALKKIKPPVIRWPGGCFADSYHWQDGIGPRENRPKRINVHWGHVIENNHFGTHEFIDFCRQVGAEPMIAANVGSGTPQEMRDWLEYLNVGGDSTLANLRAKNGRHEPFNVRYVCIGNENWGCGGSMDPSHYALLYRQFSEYCHFPPKEGFYRVACGPSSDNYDWTREFFKTMVGKETKGRNRLGRVQAFDMHYYTWGRDYGTATEYRIDEWYGLLAKGLGLEEVALKHWEIMGEYDPGHSVKLAVCEWGVWHHVMPGTNERFLRQQNSMRDALLAALTLDIFNRHCDKIGMANIAQTINVLQCMMLTKGAEMITTPTYHVFGMYVPHQGAEALQCDVTTTQIAFTDKRDKPNKLPHVAASCSRKGDTLT